MKYPVTFCKSIQQMVAAEFGLRLAELTCYSRARRFCWPRQVAMYLCRQFTVGCLTEIARQFGKKCHGTVKNACELVRAQCSDDRAPAERSRVERLERRIRRLDPASQRAVLRARLNLLNAELAIVRKQLRDVAGSQPEATDGHGRNTDFCNDES